MATLDFTETQAAPIELTENALLRVRSLLQEQGHAGHALRVFVQEGGCSGYQYGMALEEQPRESDHRFTFENVHVVVDPFSMTHLTGAVIDYVDDLMGGGFHIENPNAVRTCGCGQSFRTEDSADAGGSHGDCC